MGGRMKTKDKKAPAHTPGPWHVGTGWIYASESKDDVAEALAVCQIGVSDRNDADAKLIAAAPRMADELKAILESSNDQATQERILSVLHEAGIDTASYYCNCGHMKHMTDRCEHRDDDGVPCDCCLSYGHYPEER